MDIARTIADAARNLTPSRGAETPGRSDRPRSDRAYRLRAGESIPDGIRRIARGQLHDARDALDDTPSRRIGEAIHATRKRLKRLRACLRLARDAIGEPTYEHENTTLRMAARRIAAQRDAQVLLETLDAVTARFADELAPSATAGLRARLEEESTAAAQAAASDDGAGAGGPIAATRASLDETLARTPAWTFERDGFEALSPGLQRIYRRGRKGLRTARADPSAENLHALRKRVKDLWYTTEIVRPARPKRLRRVSRRAHKLSSLLGDHHDLHVLRAYVQTHPQCFEGETSQRALLAVIDRRATRLCEKSLARATKLYAPKPKRFVREIERGWRKRAPRAPRSQAG